MKKLIIIAFWLFYPFFICISSDKDTYLAITFDVYYHNSKEPYQYYWLMPTKREPYSLFSANPVYICADPGGWNHLLEKKTSLKDTIPISNCRQDINGTYCSPEGTVGFVPSFLKTVIEHRVLIQKGKVRNNFSHPVTKRLAYTVKVYVTPVYGEFRQVVKCSDRYTVPVYYPASEIEFADSYWRDGNGEWVKYFGHFLQLPFMILSGCETAPDFTFTRMVVGQ